MQPRWLSALFGLAALALFFLTLAHTVRQLARHEDHNWDMLPAMALALEWEVKDPVELHRRTYALAQTELPPEVYADFTRAGVRAVRAQDPAAFYEHLPFYRARVLYSIAVAFLHRQGMALSAATWWVPIGCYVLTSLLVLAWAASHLSFGLAALFALGIAHTPALLNQAGTSGADGLASLFVYLGAWALIERRLFFVAAPLLTLAIGARPDSVILIGFLAAALFFLMPRDERPQVPVLLLWVVLSGGVAYGLSRFAGEYGWWPLIRITFVEKTVHPAELPTTPDWNEYLGILRQRVEPLPGDGYQYLPQGAVSGSTGVLAYAALGLVAIALAWRVEQQLAALVVALLLTYCVRFLLFPQLWDRFFAPLYVLVPLALVSLVVPGAPAPVPRVRTLRRTDSSSSSARKPVA